MNYSVMERLEELKNGIVPRGYEKTDIGIFPDDWKIVPLSEVVRVFRGASPRPKEDPRYYGGNIPRLLIEDVTRDGKYVFPSVDSLTEEGAKKSRYLPKGSLVLSCSGTRVAIPGILGIPACIHDGFFGFDDYRGLLPEYLYYFFEHLHEKMQSSATKGGVFNNLTTQIMKEMLIQLPSMKEQQLIAEVFNTWDKAIELKEKLIELKREQKKGLLQKLLMGKVRLPGFEGKWKEASLDKFIQEYKGKSTVPNQFPILTSSRRGLMLQSEYYSNNQVTTNDNVGYNIIPQGYITYRSRSDDGKFVFNKNTIVDYGIVSYFYPVFKFNDKVCGDFILELLNFTIERQASSFVEGTAQKVLSLKKLGTFKYLIPNVEEQEAIAKVLNLVSKEITLLESELETVKHQKRGLMQLFLTGKVRVKV
ncbi:hypothetical protein PAESOLCIP111_01321 [Paenibacillus solanacearum]|uniref:Type I restriction modification DNA specificity domain-containing protein n=1 Tax=Paenibacillus solanacearum TaxID=2048548 RepID=A0A916JWT8_9BACL|nr:restriction endonuclease subunit S [Paenibacillus solanacearum]CAG7611021.1 hypothetical protein PAESOLCIP111_01321 [Paenibacillus solanacearum]